MKTKKQKFTSPWFETFESAVHSALQDINVVEKDLTNIEVKKLASYSRDYVLKQKDTNPENYLFSLPRMRNGLFSHEKLKSKKPKKSFLFVTAIFPGLTHGGGLRIWDMMEELTIKGHEVTLVTARPRIGEEKELPILKKLLKNVSIFEHYQMNESFLIHFLDQRKEIYDAAYFVWPHAAPLICNGSPYIRKHFFEYIEVTTRRVWMDLVSHIRNKEFSKIDDKIGDFWMCYQWEKLARERAEGLICLTEKDAEFVKKVFKAQKVNIVRQCCRSIEENGSLCIAAH